jgi:hypothetical protein
MLTGKGWHQTTHRSFSCSIYQRKVIHQQVNKTSEGDRQVLWRSFLLDQMCSHWLCFLLCQCRHGIKF